MHGENLELNLSEIFAMLRKIQRHIIVNVRRSSFKVPAVLARL